MQCMETFTPETLDAALAHAPVQTPPPPAPSVSPVPQAYSGADQGDTAPGQYIRHKA